MTTPVIGGAPAPQTHLTIEQAHQLLLNLNAGIEGTLRNTHRLTDLIPSFRAAFNTLTKLGDVTNTRTPQTSLTTLGKLSKLGFTVLTAPIDGLTSFFQSTLGQTIATLGTTGLVYKAGTTVLPESTQDKIGTAFGMAGDTVGNLVYTGLSKIFGTSAHFVIRQTQMAISSGFQNLKNAATNSATSNAETLENQNSIPNGNAPSIDPEDFFRSNPQADQQSDLFALATLAAAVGAIYLIGSKLPSYARDMMTTEKKQPKPIKA